MSFVGGQSTRLRGNGCEIIPEMRTFLKSHVQSLLWASIGLLLCGCGSGASGSGVIPAAPRINAVIVHRLQSIDLQLAELEATVSGDADRIEWTLPRGFEQSFAEGVRARVRIADYGYWVGSVRACNGEECSEPFEFSFVLASPGISGIEPFPIRMVAGEETELTISRSSVELRWSFPPSFEVEESGVDKVRIRCGLPGAYEAFAQGCPVGFLGCEPIFHFPIEVLAP